MTRYFCTVVILVFGLFIETLSQRGFRRGFKYPHPSEDSETPDQVYAFPYEELPKYIFRNNDEERREVEQVRPLCEEERRSQNIRELIQERAASFLQTSNSLDLRKYTLIPRKIDLIKCVNRENSGDDTNAVCKPENCRERKVDVEIFGRQKNETNNIWEFIGTLSAIPVACECFVRWKPEKCSRAVDVFPEF